MGFMLINCRECKNNISDEAKICPQCGTRNPHLSQKEYEKRKREKVIYSLIGIPLLIWGILYILIGGYPPEIISGICIFFVILGNIKGLYNYFKYGDD